MGKGKGGVGMVAPALNGVVPLIQKTITKLNQLDALLGVCIEEAGLTQEEVGEILQADGPYSGAKGEWILVKDVKYPQTKPTGVPPNPQSPYTDNNGNIWDYQITDENSNDAYNEQLLLQLRPNSPNPISHREFNFEIQYDPKNEFSFDSRRIKASATFVGVKGNPNVVIYNLPNNGYSYSSSVTVLINETKFRIDNFINNNPEYNRLQVRPNLPPAKGGSKLK